MFLLHRLTFVLQLISCVLGYNDLNPSEREMGPLVRYDAPEKGTASLIMFHGLSDTPAIFTTFRESIRQQERFNHINLVFPTAPLRDMPFVASIMDPIVHSWFNSSATGLGGGYDEEQYWEIVDYVQRLVLNETVHGILPNRIIVGGFSQGGMETLGALASIHTKVGGWLFFPTAIPQNLTRFDSMFYPINKKTPVFHGHGLNDTGILPADAIRTANLFKKLGYNYHLHFYLGMGHQADWAPHNRDAENWLEKIIPKKWHK